MSILIIIKIYKESLHPVASMSENFKKKQHYQIDLPISFEISWKVLNKERIIF